MQAQLYIVQSNKCGKKSSKNIPIFKSSNAKYIAWCSFISIVWTFYSCTSQGIKKDENRKNVHKPYL